LLEILIKTLSVKLLRSRLIGVELSSVEHRSSLSPALIGELTSLQSSILLLNNPFLFRNDTLLMSQNCVMTLFFQLKVRTKGNRFRSSGASSNGSTWLAASSVGGESS